MSRRESHRDTHSSRPPESEPVREEPLGRDLGVAELAVVVQQSRKQDRHVGYFDRGGKLWELLQLEEGEWGNDVENPTYFHGAHPAAGLREEDPAFWVQNRVD
jgi:hypothetical protein